MFKSKTFSKRNDKLTGKSLDVRLWVAKKERARQRGKNVGSRGSTWVSEGTGSGGDERVAKVVARCESFLDESGES